MPDDDQYPELEPGIPVPEEPVVQSQYRVIPTGTSGLPLKPRIEPPAGILESSRANQPYVPTDPTERMWAAMEREFGGLPLAQAQKAVETALKFQGMRVYQQELAKGTPAAEALAKAGPMLFGASGMRAAAMAPKPSYQFVPGTEQMPATFQAPGQRPVIVPQSAMPQTATASNPVKTEIFPGQFLVQVPGTKKWQIVDGAGKNSTLNPAQAGQLLAKIEALENQAGTNVMSNLKPDLARIVQGGVPKPAGGVQPPAAAAPVAASPAPTTATATAPKFREGQLIRNKRTGKLYKIVNGVPVEQ